MHVKHYNLDELLKEAKRWPVRIQITQRMQQIRYGQGKSASYIPHVSFEITVSAKTKNEVLAYTEPIATIMLQETRRINTMREKALQREKEIKNQAKKAGHNIMAGVYSPALQEGK